MAQSGDVELNFARPELLGAVGTNCPSTIANGEGANELRTPYSTRTKMKGSVMIIPVSSYSQTHQGLC